MQDSTQQLPTSSMEHWIRCVQSISTCARTLRRLLAQHLTDTGLNEVEFLLLWSCQSHGDGLLPQNQLVSLLAVSPAQLSTTVDRMVKRKLVETARHATDRRRQSVRLTEAGKRLLTEVRAGLQGVSQYFKQRVTADEQVHLMELLNRLGGQQQGLRIFVADPTSDHAGHGSPAEENE